MPPRKQGGALPRLLKRVVGPVIGLLLFAGALWVLRRELGEHSLKDVVAALRLLAIPQIGLCLLFTVLGYLALSGQDLLALKSLGVRLSPGKALLAGFEGFAFANNLPFAMVAGGAVRARFYAGSRLSTRDTTSLILFNAITYALGLLGAAGLAFTFEPAALPGLLGLPIHSTLPLGIVALTLLALFLFWSWHGGPAIRIGKHSLRPTPIGWSFARLGVSLLDWVFSGAALFVLLPGADAFHFPGFLGVFMLGQLLGLLAQLPGGIGVFEAAVVRMLGPAVPVPTIFGALLMYRVIYSLLPLGVATIILVAHEVRRARSRG